MSEHLKLFTPGPGDVDEEVLIAAAHPVLRHYGPEWMEFYHDMITMLRTIFQTQNDIFMVPGSGTALMDMAIGSLMETGKTMIVGNNGFFGDRLDQIAQGYGIHSVPFTAPLGQPLDPGQLHQLLLEHPEAQVVALVHHETATCVLNPLKELAEVAKAAGKLLIVDAVSSLGGVDLPVDDWNIDVCVTSANKCLEALPGVGFISVSKGAWEQVDRISGTGHGWYLNLRTWRQYLREWGTWHPSPVTLPVNTFLAVHTSMRQIVNRGLPAQFARYKYASQAVRRGLENLGFEMFVPDAYASPVATSVKAHPKFEVSLLSNWLVSERQIVIGGGLRELSGKIFRVGHLGKAAEREYLLEFLFAVEEFMRTRGIPVPSGASLIALS